MKKKGEIPKWCWVYGFKVVTDVRPNVKHRPIMFKAPMVRAILEGRKTQTRRPVKQAIPEDADEVFFWAPGKLVATTMPRVAPSGLWVRRNDSEEGEDGWVRHLGPSPYGLTGDRLWVRETWADISGAVGAWAIAYRANCPDDSLDIVRGGDPVAIRVAQWRPSIHMPRWASRLTLEIVSVRVERVEAISGEDAVAEGIRPFIGGPWGTHYAVAAEDEPHATAQAAFLGLWRSMYGS